MYTKIELANLAMITGSVRRRHGLFTRDTWRRRGKRRITHFVALKRVDCCDCDKMCWRLRHVKTRDRKDVAKIKKTNSGDKDINYGSDTDIVSDGSDETSSDNDDDDGGDNNVDGNGSDDTESSSDESIDDGDDSGDDDDEWWNKGSSDDENVEQAVGLLPTNNRKNSKSTGGKRQASNDHNDAGTLTKKAKLDTNAPKENKTKTSILAEKKERELPRCKVCELVFEKVEDLFAHRETREHKQVVVREQKATWCRYLKQSFTFAKNVVKDLSLVQSMQKAIHLKRSACGA
eukprot:m.73997 g.73997  ORF g.73997 m.73997 type:complete len:290 (-) comp12442_c0_seq3:1516-2385(-)